MLRSAPHPNAHNFGERLTNVTVVQSGADTDTTRVIDFAGVQLEVGGLTLMPFIHKIQWWWIGTPIAPLANLQQERAIFWYTGTETTAASLSSPPSTVRDCLANDMVLSGATEWVGNWGTQGKGTVHYSPAVALPTGKMTVRLTSTNMGIAARACFLIHYTFEHKGADEFLTAFVNQNLKV